MEPVFDVPTDCSGSLAAVGLDSSRISAFEDKAVIHGAAHRHKKARYKAGLASFW